MCDSIVVDRKLSGKGCTVFGKASDRRVNEPQPFVYVPAAAEIRLRRFFLPFWATRAKKSRSVP